MKPTLEQRISILEKRIGVKYNRLRESSAKSEAAEVLQGLVDNDDISQEDCEQFLDSANESQLERVAEFGLKFDYCQSEYEADRVAEKLLTIVNKQLKL